MNVKNHVDQHKRLGVQSGTELIVTLNGINVKWGGKNTGQFEVKMGQKWSIEIKMEKKNYT